MKKIMFLQIKGKSFGGIWLVNKTLANKFLELGYDVQVCSVRDNHPGNYEKTEFKQLAINPTDEWEIVHRRDVINALKKGPTHCCKTFIQYIKDNKKLHNDYKKMKKYITEENPDYIIASHYGTLPGIPKDFLKKTVHVQHSSFELVKSDKANFKTLKKYNNSLNSLVWLSKSACNIAEKTGFINNKYIYNPARITCENISDVVNNKCFIVLSRFAPEKRIDLMIKLVDDVFKNEKFSDWQFCLYGDGKLSKTSLDIIEKSNQIFLKGVVSNPKEPLLKSSCSLNTSIYEGFPLSFIESITCGVPIISFNYGESASEILDDGNNGFIIPQNDVDKFKEKLEVIMSDNELLKKMSLNSKKNSLKYEVDSVVNEWLKIFENIDK